MISRASSDVMGWGMWAWPRWKSHPVLALIEKGSPVRCRRLAIPGPCFTYVSHVDRKRKPECSCIERLYRSCKSSLDHFLWPMSLLIALNDRWSLRIASFFTWVSLAATKIRNSLIIAASVVFLSIAILRTLLTISSSTLSVMLGIENTPYIFKGYYK